MKYLSIIALFLVAACTTIAPSYTASKTIHLNQIGFYSDGPKTAIAIECEASDFRLLDKKGKTVFEGKLSETQRWEPSAENVKQADFSAFTEEGTYSLVIDGFGQSYTFEIGDEVHADALTGAIKGFYFQRSSSALEEKYAGKWHRPAGHPDTNVLVHKSGESASRPEGTSIVATKGWYDAGDYGKYIVNSGISTATLLSAYEHFPDLLSDLNTNIPESGNAVPDILDEIRWNLEWMLTMQVNAPRKKDHGSVYHKLTTKRFEGAVMPHKAVNQRYAIGRNPEDALNFAGVMAQAARIYKPFDEAFAAQCLQAAEDAFLWALANPEIKTFRNPQDIVTGGYGGSNLAGCFQWAAIELAISTGNKTFMAAKPFTFDEIGGLNWGNPQALALMTLSNIEGFETPFKREKVKDAILKMADDYVVQAEESAYAVAFGGNGRRDFNWGSNSTVANHGIFLVTAYKHTGDKKYLDAAISNLDYLFGRNATGYSFLTGFGDKPTMNIHHRQSEDDGLDEPVPGLLAGGPNIGRQDGCDGYIGEEPAKSYSDTHCSYASNEIAINWNAPLVYLLTAVESLK